ncbi:hypothetical protein HY310_00645, partial [Candidatus Microgenomates bacterium]|nr:hypothetical protein [Candidatus Microgenomates bacterium]
DVSNKLREISLAGETTNVGDRAVISSKNKKEVSLTKISAAQAILTGKEGSRIDLFSGQQKLSEANLYLREAVSYLMEIVRNITG